MVCHGRVVCQRVILLTQTEFISSGSDGLIINTTITLSSKRFVYRLVLDLQTIAVAIL
jgi:hypothetical protein